MCVCLHMYTGNICIGYTGKVECLYEVEFLPKS